MFFGLAVVPSQITVTIDKVDVPFLKDSCPLEWSAYIDKSTASQGVQLTSFEKKGQ